MEMAAGVDEIANYVKKTAHLHSFSMKFIGQCKHVEQIGVSSGSHIKCIIGATSGGTSSAEILFNVFAELNREGFQKRSLMAATFVGFDFAELPPNIGQVLVQLKYCILMDCPNLSSLETTIRQFPALRSLVCRDCPSMTSLSSLKVLPRHGTLCELSFNNCGLEVTPADDWDEGMRALGRSNQNSCTITIQNCHSLKMIPQSIIHLKGKAGRVQIILSSNDALRKIPFEIGELKNLKVLQCHHCPQLLHLPWTISRIPDCRISLNGSFNLIQSVAKHVAVVEDEDSVSDSDSATFRVRGWEMEGYFQNRRRKFIMGIIKLKIYLVRSRKRVIHRLYQPGGAAFLRSKENFERIERMALNT